MKNRVPFIKNKFIELKISIQKNIKNKRDNKTFTGFKIEKHINNFHKRYSECKVCNSKRGVKRYYNDEDKISNQ